MGEEYQSQRQRHRVKTSMRTPVFMGRVTGTLVVAGLLTVLSMVVFLSLP